MNILLISKTQIVIQIFELICKKLDYTLSIVDHNDIKHKYDIIVVDTEFIDDRFNIIKQLSKAIGAITNEDLSMYNSDYFVINRPFLPTQLLEILKEQEELIKDYKEETYSVTDDDYFDDTTHEVASFVESLADDIAMENSDEEDESIVTLESLNNGGVLDNLELNKIHDILQQNQRSFGFQEDVVLEETDWQELTDIIDDALDEVKGYEFSLSNEPLHLILNNYHIDELRPLLKKFDQNIIDKLSNGETIDLKLSLKAKN